MNKWLAICAIAVFGASAHAGDYGKWFDKVDANADGFLTADELGEKKAYKIQKLDSDGDGMISRDEYMTHKAHKKHKKDDSV